MPRIRVGLIGLGTSTNSLAPGAWGALAHLPSLLASPDYTIKALCNSSVESAQASITFHNLPSETKAYGSPEDLANDPEVDLVICSVQVSKHYDLVKPALLNGKDVFVEWPLAATTSQAEELVEIARTHKSKTFVGCQARAAPVVVKLKELIDGGNIGDVLSSVVTGSIAGLPPKWPVNAAYFQDINSGGNVLTIYYGHFLDSFIHVLGDFDQVNSILKVDNPTISLFGDDGEIAEETHLKSTPDEIFVQGVLQSGAIVSINYRQTPVKIVSDAAAIRWIITGTKGEIEITTPIPMWQMNSPLTNIKLRVEDGEVVDVSLDSIEEPDYVSTIGPVGRNTSRAYEAYAKNDANKYPDFEQALATHRTLDRIRGGIYIVS